MAHCRPTLQSGLDEQPGRERTCNSTARCGPQSSRGFPGALRTQASACRAGRKQVCFCPPHSPEGIALLGPRALSHLLFQVRRPEKPPYNCFCCRLPVYTSRLGLDGAGSQCLSSRRHEAWPMPGH